jgi:hypothetical protein
MYIHINMYRILEKKGRKSKNRFQYSNIETPNKLPINTRVRVYEETTAETFNKG